jgi:hypothetical protein
VEELNEERRYWKEKYPIAKEEGFEGEMWDEYIKEN